MLHHPLQFLQGSLFRVNVSRPQVGCQQVLATEQVEWGITDATVICVEKCLFLMPVYLVIRDIQV